MLVCVSSHNFAHETAGAARTRSSLRPLFSKGERLQKTSRKSCGEIAERCIAYERATFPLVIARLDRAPSIPETTVIEPTSHGVLDTPHARSMTAVGCLNFRVLKIESEIVASGSPGPTSTCRLLGLEFGLGHHAVAAGALG